MSSLFCYIDPGTGAIVLQVIIAAVFSVGLVFRRYFVSPLFAIKRAIFRQSSDTSDNPDSAHENLQEPK